MKLGLYSVFDKAVGAYLPPFTCRSKGEALRSFADASNNKEHNFNRHSMDYVLVHLGEFDDASALFLTHEPERMLAAHEMVDTAA